MRMALNNKKVTVDDFKHTHDNFFVFPDKILGRIPARESDTFSDEKYCKEETLLSVYELTVLSLFSLIALLYSYSNLDI